jgi:hypothetical protein
MGELTDSNLALALVNVTPGLQVADHTGTPILSTNGQIYELGDGNLLSFRPSFFTTEATQERYSAAFRLLDLNGTFLDSGTFHIDFVQAPEPATLWLVAQALRVSAALPVGELDEPRSNGSCGRFPSRGTEVRNNRTPRSS